MAETQSAAGLASAKPLWLPAPSRVRYGGAWLRLPRDAVVAIAQPTLLLAAAERLVAEAGGRAGATWSIRADGAPAAIRVAVAAGAADGPEAYRLQIADAGVEIAAADVAGARHG